MLPTTTTAAQQMHDHPSAAISKAPAPAIVEEATVDVCLAAAAVAGAALLAWWAVSFHPTYAHLWMVPVGLVLAGTPPVVCLALRFSGGDGDGPPRVLAAGKGVGSPPLPAVVVHK